MSFQRLDTDVARRALDVVGWPEEPTAIRSVEDGVNDVFVVSLPGESPTADMPNKVVCKFATFSKTASFGAGVQTTHLLNAQTGLPVPAVYEFRPDPPDLPAFQIQEYLPGEPLSGYPEADSVGPVRALGTVIREMGAVPATTTEGYGLVETQESGQRERGDSDTPKTVRVTGEYDDCAQWVLDYARFHYEDPPDHDALASVTPAVPEYLSANAPRLPTQPDQAVVLTDFGPSNLLAPAGRVSPDGRLSDLSGLLDLERAKLGPIEFTAVNAEYLMTRGLERTDAVVEALYEPLPFGPDVPNRDLYRLVAMGRSVNALDLWYEEGGERFQRRGAELADQIAQLV